jgi:hypothetical protein
VSISKFVKNLLLQIALFCMSSSKAWSLCVSRSKFSLTFMYNILQNKFINIIS